MQLTETPEMLKMLLLFLLPSALCSPKSAPDGPQGPSGAILRHDLLTDSFSGGSMGAFEAIYDQPCYLDSIECNHNNELQTYLPELANQASNGEITLKGEGRPDGIFSAKIQTAGIWTTSTNADVKMRGYLEVRANLPAKVDGGEFTGSWPAIWLLGYQPPTWPACGELDMVEVVNGKPSVVMTTHSSGHNGGNGQHPSEGGRLDMNANLVDNELIAGFEWNLENPNQIDLTWWMSYFDLGSQSWVSAPPRTLVIQSGHGQDFHEFYNTFTGTGFFLIINLAEGGTMPGTSDVFVNGQPQYIVVKSAKVYGF